MPAEQEDEARDRQIDALRRYVADLGGPRDRPAGGIPKPPPAPERRPQATVPWLLLTVVLVAAALVGGVLIGQARATVDRGTAAEPGGGATATTLGGPVSTAECKAAVDRANEALAAAVRVRGILSDYTQVMNQLETRRITPAEAIRLGRPSEVAGAAESAKFNKALTSYTQVVDKCRSREP
jgi:hypothetical protein